MSIEEAVDLLISQGKRFDPRTITHMTNNPSLTEVGIKLKYMFNDKKMPGYTFQHYEGPEGLFQVYYKQVGFMEQLRNIMKGKL